MMKKLLTMAALVAAVACSAATVQAANVTLSGYTSSNSSLGNFQALRTFTLSVDYNPNNSGNTATIKNSTLTISTDSGNKVFSFGTGSSGSITLGAGNPTPATISITYKNPSAVSGSGVPLLGSLVLHVSHPHAGLYTVASQANIDSIIRPGSSYYSGSISDVDFTTNVFDPVDSVSFAIPEPGSIGLLAGLGCVVGRRLWRRRQQKPAAAV